jgi:hypothetical protein
MANPPERIWSPRRVISSGRIMVKYKTVLYPV